jgi:hypothetical protein
MIGVDMADKYLRYYSILRNTVKWPHLYAKLCIPQCNFVYKTLNPRKKEKKKYKNFLRKVARFQISEVQYPNESSSDELHSLEKQPTPSGPNESPHLDSTRISANKLDKIVAGGEGKQYPTRQCNVHATDKKQMKTGYNCKFCIIKGLVSQTATQLETGKLSICSLFSIGFRSIIYIVEL